MGYRFLETETERAISDKLHKLAIEWAEENGVEALAEKLDLLPIGAYIFLKRVHRPMGEIYRACEMLGVEPELILEAIASALLPSKEL